ncbi:MAG TPA: SIMPL domain-containing protein [Gemmatimonadaceae bacterium]|nr:SIMPL domain-containing protein [Gemmatimonadaceae bacterium]
MPPQIVTSGQGEVRLAPDKATISVGVQTRAATAADAAAQNSRKQRAVIDAIRARGVDATQIGTSGFAVIPETRYDKDQTPRTVSYLVSNVVTVELRRVDQVGAVIDAALAAGANQINSLDFGLSSADSARRVALSTAVSRARADAEAMARAAGGSLGPLIELTAADLYVPPPRPVAMVMRAEAAQDTSVPVEAGQETVRASVTARWQFIQGGQPK